MKVLLKFFHGIGDVAQFTGVVRALKEHHQDWIIDIETDIGKHTMFNGLANQVFTTGQSPANGYSEIFPISWHENMRCSDHSPSTKVEKCLSEVFDLPTHDPVRRYSIQISPDAQQAAIDYYAEIGATKKSNDKLNVVLIHYQGNTSRSRKDLPVDTVQSLCGLILKCNHIPVILDWDSRSPIPNNKTIFCPDKLHPLWMRRSVGDGERIAALCEQASLVVAIDSGPQKIAAATKTPMIAIWTHHHPIHYLPPLPQVLNLVPKSHASSIRNPKSKGTKYFNENYRYYLYDDLDLGLSKACCDVLFPDGSAKQYMSKLIPQKRHQFYYMDAIGGGLDYLSFGAWQASYGKWIVDSLSMQHKRVLDVGCACGALTKSFKVAGAVSMGIDINEYMINLGRNSFPELAPDLFVCDAANMHLIDTDSIDMVHSSQCPHEWKLGLVPTILKEIYRVTRPAGYFFATLGSSPNTSDNPDEPTVRSMDWWNGQLEQAGWSQYNSDSLLNHPNSYIKQYEWSWWLCRKETASMPEFVESTVPDLFLRSKMREQDQVVVTDVYNNDCYQINPVAAHLNTVIDVGAHIGAFTRKIRDQNKLASIAAVEAHPDNVKVLQRNLAIESATDAGTAVFGAALSYEPGELVIHGTVYEGCPTTGGSFVSQADDETWKDMANAYEYKQEIKVEKITIEQIMEKMGWTRVDLLKLDCEGSEFSILENADVSCIKTVVGEWHHKGRMFALVRNPKFKGWKFDILKDGQLGLFRLTNDNIE